MPLSVHLIGLLASQHVDHQMMHWKLTSAWVLMVVCSISLAQAANQSYLYTEALIVAGLLLTPVVVGITSCSHHSLVPYQMHLLHGSGQTSKSTAHCHLSWIQEWTSYS